MKGLARRTLETAQGIEIDNRAPSLAEWVANEVDDALKVLLNDVRGPRRDIVMSAEPLDLVSMGTPRVRTWERTWKLSSHTGILVKVALMVDEANDAEVQARVDSEMVFRAIPPWIERRLQPDAAAPMAPSEDEAQRARFRERILDAVRVAVEQRRAAVDTSH
jgi:hypothetical protein